MPRVRKGTVPEPAESKNSLLYDIKHTLTAATTTVRKPALLCCCCVWVVVLGEGWGWGAGVHLYIIFSFQPVSLDLAILICSCHTLTSGFNESSTISRYVNWGRSADGSPCRRTAVHAERREVRYHLDEAQEQSPAEGAAQPASQRAAALALVTFRVLLAGTGICTSRAQDIPQGASKHSSPGPPVT